MYPCRTRRSKTPSLCRTNLRSTRTDLHKYFCFVLRDHVPTIGTPAISRPPLSTRTRLSACVCEIGSRFMSTLGSPPPPPPSTCASILRNADAILFPPPPSPPALAASKNYRRRSNGRKSSGGAKAGSNGVGGDRIAHTCGVHAGRLFSTSCKSNTFLNG